jgi:hypothetical protein
MNHIPKGVEEEEAATCGRTRAQDRPKTLKQRLNPVPCTPPKGASSERVALRFAAKTAKPRNLPGQWLLDQHVSGFPGDEERGQAEAMKKVMKLLKQKLDMTVNRASQFTDEGRGTSLSLLLEPKGALEGRWGIADSQEPTWQGPPTHALVDEAVSKVTKALGFSRPMHDPTLQPWNNMIAVTYWVE